MISIWVVESKEKNGKIWRPWDSGYVNTTLRQGKLELREWKRSSPTEETFRLTKYVPQKEEKRG